MQKKKKVKEEEKINKCSNVSIENLYSMSALCLHIYIYCSMAYIFLFISMIFKATYMEYSYAISMKIPMLCQ